MNKILVLTTTLVVVGVLWVVETGQDVLDVSTAQSVELGITELSPLGPIGGHAMPASGHSVPPPEYVTVWACDYTAGSNGSIVYNAYGEYVSFNRGTSFTGCTTNIKDIVAGEQVEIVWESEYMDSCSVTGGASSGFSLSDSTTGEELGGSDESIAEPSGGNQVAFTMSCSGPYGSDNGQADVYKLAQCEDGIDNDGDGKIDYDMTCTAYGCTPNSGHDPECSAPDDDSEAGASPSATLEIRINGGSWSGSNQTIEATDDIDLQWSSANAASCSVTNGGSAGFVISGGATSGNDLSITNPGAGNNQTFAISCDGATDSLLVTVNAPAAGPNLTVNSFTPANGSIFTDGGTINLSAVARNNGTGSTVVGFQTQFKYQYDSGGGYGPWQSIPAFNKSALAALSNAPADAHGLSVSEGTYQVEYCVDSDLSDGPNGDISESNETVADNCSYNTYTVNAAITDDDLVASNLLADGLPLTTNAADTVFYYPGTILFTMDVTNQGTVASDRFSLRFPVYKSDEAGGWAEVGPANNFNSEDFLPGSSPPRPYSKDPSWDPWPISNGDADTYRVHARIFTENAIGSGYGTDTDIPAGNDFVPNPNIEGDDWYYFTVGQHGQCGTADRNYAYDATNYIGTFCSAGNPSPASPVFPANWTCQGIGPGANNDSCTISVDPAPECDDGIDNDGDGDIDYPADPGCDSLTDDDESDDPVTSCTGDFTANPTTIRAGESTTIEWENDTDAATCGLYRESQLIETSSVSSCGTTHSTNVTLTNSTTFFLYCSDTGNPLDDPDGPEVRNVNVTPNYDGN